MLSVYGGKGCGHCKSLAPQWERAAKSLKNMVRLGAVDATVDSQLACNHSFTRRSFTIHSTE
jgi:thiol-disulfide isomerase/thioredoxin